MSGEPRKLRGERHSLAHVALEDDDHPELRNRDSIEFIWGVRTWSAMVRDNEDSPRLIVQPSRRDRENVLPVDDLVDSLTRGKASLIGVAMGARETRHRDDPHWQTHHWLTKVALEDDDHPELRHRDSREFTWAEGSEPNRDRIWSVMVLDNDGVPRLIVQPSPWDDEVVLNVDELIDALGRARARLMQDKTLPW